MRWSPKTRANYASLFYIIKNAEPIHAGKGDIKSLGVSALNDKTLVIKLENPTPFLPELLAHFLAVPLPSHTIEKLGDAWIRPERAVSNGAFVLKQWVPNQFIRLEKNPNFYAARDNCLETILVYSAADSSSSARQIQSGELDATMTFNGSARNMLKKQLPAYVRETPYMQVAHLFFNSKDGPFNDKAVRQAFSIAIDRDFIARSIIGGPAQPALSFVPLNVSNYPSGPIPKFFDGPLVTRQERARQLLEAVGYGPQKPLRVTLSYSIEGEDAQFVPALQLGWQGIAPWVRVDLAGTQSQIHYEKSGNGDFQISSLSWYADFNDAKNFLYIFETRSGQINSGRYSNAIFDNLMLAADANPILDVRKRLMREAEILAMTDAASAPLFFGSAKALVNPRITGWSNNPLHLHRLRWLCTTNARTGTVGHSED